MNIFFKLFFCFVILSISSILWADSKKIVNVYNWANYISEDILEQFEKETGIHVNYATFLSNEALYAKLKINPKVGYDVIVPSTYFIERMKKADLLQPLDHTRLPNFKNLDPKFLDHRSDPKNQYTVPYLWVATGIVINTKYHKVEDFQSWKALWDPKYANQLMILNDAREIFSIALMCLNLSPNETKPDRIEQAHQKLKLLWPNIRLFNSESYHSVYIDEDLTVGIGWNSDFYRAQQENKHLAFIYPKEGFVTALDSMAIPKHAKHVENAHRFINFVLREDIARKIALATGCSIPNLAAYHKLPLAMKNSTVLYPHLDLKVPMYFQEDVGSTANLYEKKFEMLKIMG